MFELFPPFLLMGNTILNCLQQKIRRLDPSPLVQTEKLRVAQLGTSCFATTFPTCLKHSIYYLYYLIFKYEIWLSNTQRDVFPCPMLPSFQRPRHLTTELKSSDICVHIADTSLVRGIDVAYLFQKRLSQ